LEILAINMYKEFENKNHECEKVVGRKNYMRKW
jgi:hypothetical protein